MIGAQPEVMWQRGLGRISYTLKSRDGFYWVNPKRLEQNTNSCDVAYTVRNAFLSSIQHFSCEYERLAIPKNEP